MRKFRTTVTGEMLIYEAAGVMPKHKVDGLPAVASAWFVSDLTEWVFLGLWSRPRPGGEDIAPDVDSCHLHGK